MYLGNASLYFQPTSLRHPIHQQGLPVQDRPPLSPGPLFPNSESIFVRSKFSVTFFSETASNPPYVPPTRFLMPSLSNSMRQTLATSRPGSLFLPRSFTAQLTSQALHLEHWLSPLPPQSTVPPRHDLPVSAPPPTDLSESQGSPAP